MTQGMSRHVSPTATLGTISVVSENYISDTYGVNVTVMLYSTTSHQQHP